MKERKQSVSMVDEKHGNTRYPDREFMTAVENNEPAATSDIADAVGCTHRTATMRLKELRDRGAVDSSKYGGSLVWVSE